VGASPELLVSHRDGVISSLVLAGTAPNAESLGSAKMDLEHVLAASSVRDGLSQFVTALATPSRTVLEFGEIKHLATRFEGRATNGSTVLDVLGTLHPTASVAGTPRAAALDLIREIEPTSRGRYAGPVGWFNTAGEGEFAIALRCGLIEENQVTLYSGGGLVQGSEPTSEFAETELKLRPMLQALGVQ
jgi:menaquinone-specific isochorismate synthase